MPEHVGDLEDVKQYVSYLMDVLGISNTFQVLIMDETAEQFADDEDGNLAASIQTMDEQWSCQLYLGKEWDHYTDRIKAESLLHEMLHLLHKPVDLVVKDHTQGLNANFFQKSAAEEQATRHLELLVSRLTSILHPFIDPYPIEFETFPRVLLMAERY